MFGFHIRTRSLDSTIPAGSPKPIVGTPRSSNEGSPRTKVGEVDTSAPFQSVKATVSLFGDAATSPRSNNDDNNKKQPLLSRKPKNSSAADEVGSRECSRKNPFFTWPSSNWRTSGHDSNAQKPQKLKLSGNWRKPIERYRN
nr:uncharacterized protein LOC113695322 [Coffea arabica]